tara:strand:+ start:5478 stop:6722 length:1245 start_codon:yes stop_codon:yes gene_type:complete
MLIRRVFSLLALLSLSMNIEVHGQGGVGQILSASDLSRIREHLPQLDDERLNDVLHSPEVVWYDDSIGVLHQESLGPGTAGFVNSQFVNNDLNSEFPWTQLKPGGFHNSPNVTTVKGFHLPRDNDQGDLIPIVWYRSPIEGLINPELTLRGWDISAPEGTVWIEVIFVDFDQQHHACEVRFRIRESDQYAVDLYRPFTTPESLAQAIVDRMADWQDSETLATLVNHLLDPDTPQLRQLRHRAMGSNVFRTVAFQAFEQQAYVDDLPPVGNNKLVRHLLDETVFIDALGSTWGPTTQSEAHVIPKNADIAFLGSDRVACARCHVDALASARRWGTQFDLGNGSVATQEFAGWVRGWSEGILSFHPLMNQQFEDRFIRQPIFRKQWIDAGIIAPYDPRVHSKTHTRIYGPLNTGRN